VKYVNDVDTFDTDFTPFIHRSSNLQLDHSDHQSQKVDDPNRCPDPEVGSACAGNEIYMKSQYFSVGAPRGR
jgi:hypothetical protein